MGVQLTFRASGPGKASIQRFGCSWRLYVCVCLKQCKARAKQLGKVLGGWQLLATFRLGVRGSSSPPLRGMTPALAHPREAQRHARLSSPDFSSVHSQQPLPARARPACKAETHILCLCTALPPSSLGEKSDSIRPQLLSPAPPRCSCRG